MMALDAHRPKTPEIAFMPMPKNPKPRVRQSHAQYYLNKQPPDVARWDHIQFAEWLADMEYPHKKGTKGRKDLVPFPYDRKAIAEDLGTTSDRIYAYWKGHYNGAPLLLSTTMTLLCKALLELKRLRGRGK